MHHDQLVYHDLELSVGDVFELGEHMVTVVDVDLDGVALRIERIDDHYEESPTLYRIALPR
ncbi:MAG: hypothetical protein ACKVT0_00435 [Planctomycetaceae bacterium]